MNTLKKQRGNLLASALGMVILIAIIFFLGAIVLQPYQAIDEKRNNELQTMINSVKGTPFELPFKAKINYYLKDDKINNEEFSKLNVLYSGYITSKSIGDEQNFSNKTKLDLEAQYKTDEQNKKFYKLLYFILGGLVLVLISVGGWRHAYGY
ncbi:MULTISPECIES: hypothetical protein [Acinetobacter calcoaceticus/baumannii complex]|uniref:hypothetical protein n=1 Tax=Acinetobacter calcoaceticus/baumannii complex TaxID=909768 RepID=UPI000C2277B2|nr:MULTISPECIES: hypothetical protein [Acinetobacter calcoaceticus/baumannii complex]PJG65537.1 hypothetical protein CVD09_15810 [Acinetobacter seifertii]RIX34707.1 hypothetical protein D3X57_19875 [Acinetobacter baumannii]RIX39223.1 hypothetical protein D3X54_17570 [Acinetobacter baumannii]RJO32792.1 hypothetical protein D3X44_16220 [Acinetobacter baumannii]